MNRLYRILLLVIFLLSVGLAGCISTVDIEGQLHETQKLVLYCRICPGIDTIRVSLTHTHLLYGSGSREEIRAIENGVVELSADNVNWMTATYDTTSQLYLLPGSDFPVLEGHTYYIRAIAPDYDEVKSSCTVPYGRDIHLRWEHQLHANGLHDGFFYDYGHYDTYLSWNDYAGEENYYAFGGEWEYEYDDYYDDEDDEFEESDPQYMYQFSWKYLLKDGKDERFFSDKGMDGQKMSYLYDYDTDPNDMEDFSDLKWVIFMDKDSYLFETTLSDMGGLSTFLLEPMQTYNNIQGGFGLFGAFVIKPAFENGKKNSKNITL